MKIYLASNRESIALVKEYAARLEALGHEITYKWWIDVERNGPDDTEVDSEVLFDCASADADGVLKCDVFWLLAPQTGGAGCWVELGMAIAKARMSWVSVTAGKDDDDDDDYTTEPHVLTSGADSRTLFTILNEVQECFESHSAAFDYLTAAAFKLGGAA